MVAYNGVELTDALEAGAIIGDCACCLPCGKTFFAEGMATVTYSLNDPDNESSGSASATIAIGSAFEIETTCCPDQNPTVFGNVTSIAWAGVTYPATGDCTYDSPKHGETTHIDTVKICGADIGYFTSITQARVLIRFQNEGDEINGNTASYTLDEDSASPVLGEGTKSYTFTSDTETVTLTVNKVGAVNEDSITENYGDYCFELPPPP